MANPQKENGFTQIANEILENLVKIPLLGSEFQVLYFIIRKTYGFHKKSDQISLTQFEIGTGLSRPTVVKTLKNLMSRNMVVKIYLPDGNIGYTFIKDHEKWVVKTHLLVKGKWETSKDVLTSGSKDVLTETSKDVLTHKRKKESIKDNTKETGVSVVLGEFKNVKLTNDEITNLEEKMGKERVRELTEELSTYMASKKTSYKSHYATIVSWHRRKGNDIKSNNKKLHVG